MDGEKLHIVVFPWLAFGHMLPYLELSKSLAARGHQISFISTTRNIKKLQPKVPPTLSQLIQFIALPLPPVDGLPAAAESVFDIPLNLSRHLEKAFDGLERPLAQFLSSSSPKPDWIIVDYASDWLPSLASKFNVPCVHFCILMAPAMAFMGPVSEVDNIDSITLEKVVVPREWMTFPTNVAFRPYEARQVLDLLSSDNALDAYRNLLTIGGCKAVALRGCNEFMPKWVPLIRDLYKKPVIQVGMLSPMPVDNGDYDTSELKIMEWLDRRSPSSVIYVAFGSQADLSIELLHELALGLELSNLSFLWALRKSTTSENKVILPVGFQERTKDRGFVIMGWVSQLKVLAHESVGGFMTHCGFSSIIESLQFGRPLILFPLFGDQGLNARAMVEEKIGFEVRRGEEDGSLTKEAVAEALRLVVVEAEGEPFRKKAKEMMEVFADKNLNERYMDDFTQYLMDHKDSK
nr:UDP-glycosyltransferase [Paris polyphylla]